MIPANRDHPFGEATASFPQNDDLLQSDQNQMDLEHMKNTTMNPSYGSDSRPEWLRNWWKQQEAERERLSEIINANYPGVPLPDPPTRPPKPQEMRVGEAQPRIQVFIPLRCWIMRYSFYPHEICGKILMFVCIFVCRLAMGFWSSRMLELAILDHRHWIHAQT